jgi:hypothetical protein
MSLVFDLPDDSMCGEMVVAEDSSVALIPNFPRDKSITKDAKAFLC